MILLPKLICPYEINKFLPKKKSHLRERIKLLFIKESLNFFYSQASCSLLDLDKCLFDGERWLLVSYEDSDSVSLGVYIENLLGEWFLSNVSKNENVYFYRFVNVFRSYVGEDQWGEVDIILKNTSNLILRENYSVYCDYRSKLDEIERVVMEHINV